MLERFPPGGAVELATLAEKHGFLGVMATDHFQPWTPQQTHASFLWNVLRAPCQTTMGDLSSGVMTPTFRMHLAPAVEASATRVVLCGGGTGSASASAAGRRLTSTSPRRMRLKRTSGSTGVIAEDAPLGKIALLLRRLPEGAKEAACKPPTRVRVLRLRLSRALTDEQAMANALAEWPVGGMRFRRSNIRSPLEFEQLLKLVR